MGLPWRSTPGWEVVAEISEQAGADVAELLLTAPEEHLRRTDLAQLAVYAAEVLALHSARDEGALAGVVAFAGHSLGEYTALYAAGALPLADSARLVAARGAAMRAAADSAPGTMAAVMGIEADAVTAMLADLAAEGGRVWLANLNEPGQTVVSGTAEGVGLLARRAAGAGAKVLPLRVGGAFHSPLMAGAIGPFAMALAATRFAGEHMPVVANVDARPHTAGADWAGLGARQITAPVLWTRSVVTLRGELGCDRFLEIGPGRTLTGLVRRISPESEAVVFAGPAPAGRAFSLPKH
jgi:[acyl-carrier-protein] S-malonyltransferase